MKPHQKLLTILFLSLLLAGLQAFADVKRIGTPRVRNYTNAVIHAGTQTWMIDNGANGLTYFANNDGVLEFDGLTWRTYPLPDQTVVRSVKATGNKRIYAGGYNEFGYFEADYFGRLNFTPLQHLLPQHQRDFGEVWKIYEIDDAIIFQAYTQMMILRDGNMEVVEAPDMFHFSFLVNNQLIINDQSEGLFKVIDNTLPEF